MSAPTHRSILVLGAGVSGLTSAFRLLEAGFDVAVLAADRSPHTTSDIAAAVWYPFHAGPRDRALAWAAESYRVFAELAAHDPGASTDAERAGVTWVDGVELWPKDLAPDETAPWWQAAVAGGVRRAKDGELSPGYNDGHGYVFRAPVIRMPRYLAWLERKVTQLGGAIVAGRVENLDEAFNVMVGTSDSRVDAGKSTDGAGPTRRTRPPALVVNCTGLAAREITGDTLLHPIRGQIVRVAPGYATRFVQATADESRLAYIIPRPDCTVLGGTAEDGDGSTEIRPETEAAILERCIALEPRLAGAPILSRAAGLRPGRAEVRLEIEERSAGMVIHNYGHGGAGVTLSWGCANEVMSLAMESAW